MACQPLRNTGGVYLDIVQLLQFVPLAVNRGAVQRQLVCRYGGYVLGEKTDYGQLKTDN